MVRDTPGPAARDPSWAGASERAALMLRGSVPPPPGVQPAVAFVTFALVASAGLALVTGALGFFAVQAYVIKLFASFGTTVTAETVPEERFLTLNGVRYDPTGSSTA